MAIVTPNIFVFYLLPQVPSGFRVIGSELNALCLCIYLCQSHGVPAHVQSGFQVVTLLPSLSSICEGQFRKALYSWLALYVFFLLALLMYHSTLLEHRISAEKYTDSLM